MERAFFQSIIIGILTYFSPIKELIHLIFLMCLVDMVTGIWKSIKIGGLKAFSSRKARRSIVKIVAYLLAVISTYGLEIVIFNSPGSYLTKGIAASIALIEIASLFENLATITGNPIFLKMFDSISTYFNRNKDIINSIDPTLDNPDKDDSKTSKDETID